MVEINTLIRYCIASYTCICEYENEKKKELNKKMEYKTDIKEDRRKGHVINTQ
jgi:hypothetical protein